MKIWKLCVALIKEYGLFGNLTSLDFTKYSKRVRGTRSLPINGKQFTINMDELDKIVRTIPTDQQELPYTPEQVQFFVNHTPELTKPIMPSSTSVLRGYTSKKLNSNLSEVAHLSVEDEFALPKNDMPWDEVTTPKTKPKKKAVVKRPRKKGNK